jgi:acetylglutamate kinase
MTGFLRVVKIGGRAQADPRAAAAIAELWRGSGGSLVLVHGGGDEVTRLQSSFGVVPQFVGGRRVTRADDIELLRMALSGAANKRLVSRLIEAGARAVGVSGEDAGLLTAVAAEPEVMGLTGSACRVDASLLRVLLAAGFLPVISPLSRDRSPVDPGAPAPPDSHGDRALNVNGDDAAAAVASALAAWELILVSDVSSVRDGERDLGTITQSEAELLISTGRAAGGMSAKLEAAVSAVTGGVPRVRISDVGALLDSGRGTVVVADAVEHAEVA